VLYSIVVMPQYICHHMGPDELQQLRQREGPRSALWARPPDAALLGIPADTPFLALPTGHGSGHSAERSCVVLRTSVLAAVVPPGSWPRLHAAVIDAAAAALGDSFVAVGKLQHETSLSDVKVITKPGPDGDAAKVALLQQLELLLPDFDGASLSVPIKLHLEHHRPDCLRLFASNMAPTLAREGCTAALLRAAGYRPQRPASADAAMDVEDACTVFIVDEFSPAHNLPRLGGQQETLDLSRVIAQVVPPASDPFLRRLPSAFTAGEYRVRIRVRDDPLEDPLNAVPQAPPVQPQETGMSDGAHAVGRGCSGAWARRPGGFQGPPSGQRLHAGAVGAAAAAASGGAGDSYNAVPPPTRPAPLSTTFVSGGGQPYLPAGGAGSSRVVAAPPSSCELGRNDGPSDAAGDPQLPPPPAAAAVEQDSEAAGSAAGVPDVPAGTFQMLEQYHAGIAEGTGGPCWPEELRAQVAASLRRPNPEVVDTLLAHAQTHKLGVGFQPGGELPDTVPRSRRRGAAPPAQQRAPSRRSRSPMQSGVRHGSQGVAGLPPPASVRQSRASSGGGPCPAGRTGAAAGGSGADPRFPSRGRRPPGPWFVGAPPGGPNSGDCVSDQRADSAAPGLQADRATSGSRAGSQGASPVQG